MIILVYYIPIWFQAIKGSSAVHSGIQNLAAVLALVFGNTFTGPIIAKVGYYAPFMIASTGISTTGIGLITTWSTVTGHPKWIGYQVLWGFGFGMGMQQPMLAVQAVLQGKDIATGISLVSLCQAMNIRVSIFLVIASILLRAISSSSSTCILNEPCTGTRCYECQSQGLIACHLHPVAFVGDFQHPPLCDSPIVAGC